jgi:two-component system sensor histidine kinase QseC
MKSGARLPTLTQHLLAWALGALLLVWGSFILLAYLTGEHEADELTDGHLASVSSLLAPLPTGGLGGVRPVVPHPELKAHDYQRSLSVYVWDAQGGLLSGTGDAPAPPFASPEGFATLRLGEPAQEWRAFSRWDEGHTHKLMVLLSGRERDELADDIADQVVAPGLWLLPAVALVLGLAIHRGLRPLRPLVHEVHALDVQQPRPLQSPAPYDELAATADAINRLVERYQAALARERELANEFAHELRTPLASLALHARGAVDAASGLERDAAIARLLARARRARLEEAAQPVDLEAIATKVVAEFAPAAHAGGRELGLASPGPFRVAGHPVLLELALRNLVENALSHTPAGTQVEVELDPAAGWLQVSDDGAARAASTGAAPEGAWQPLKLGLGHRVVEKVAALHGGSFVPELALPRGRRAWRLRLPGPAQE